MFEIGLFAALVESQQTLFGEVVMLVLAEIEQGAHHNLFVLADFPASLLYLGGLRDHIHAPGEALQMLGIA